MDTTYHKINSVFLRGDRGKFLMGQYSEPEFEYLADKPWLWTEKIDGTNVRVMWYPKSKMLGPANHKLGPLVEFGGREDNAQMPLKLVTRLQELFPVERFQKACLEDDVILYGEGYGAGIAKGGGNYSPIQDFILFDVKIGRWWLSRENVEDIARKLQIPVVPLLGTNDAVTLEQMIKIVQYPTTPHSGISPNALVEGWVGTPLVPLFNRKGERIITKIKYKDFK